MNTDKKGWNADFGTSEFWIKSVSNLQTSAFICAKLFLLKKN